MFVINCLGSNSIKHLQCILRNSERLVTTSTGHGMKTKKTLLKKSYETLGVSEDCEDEALRQAFVHLAKQFHPDGGSRDASAAKFSEIETAYRTIQKERSIQREKDAKLPPGVEELDIKHTAPQHRHYLQYDTGIGTPSVRQHRHTVERAQQAAENVMEHRLSKIQAAERNTLVGMDKSRAKNIKTRYGIDRLVEDLIQEAMNKGEFSNLPGTGKPLRDNSSSQNPYVDFVTHKMNQVLIDNGFTPEWIQLSKEIREDRRDVEERLRKSRQKLGPTPLSPEDSRSWRDTIVQLNERVKRINAQIDKYNLLVPVLQKQMLHVDLKNLEARALEQPVDVQSRKDDEEKHKPMSPVMNDQSSFLDALFFAFNAVKKSK